MSTRPRIVQLLSGFEQGDATSNAARCLHDWFTRMGFESELVVVDGCMSPRLVHACRPLSQWKPDAGSVVIYHYGIASKATEAFRSAPGKRVLIYHNITPASFFRGFDDGIAALLEQGRADLQAIARSSHAVWAVSAFNAAELTALGVANVRVLPLVFATEHFDLPADGPVQQRYAVPLTNILSVGRLAPNKGLEDLIEGFAHYHRHWNPYSRLILVGSLQVASRYEAMLRMLVAELDVPNVHLEGFVSAGDLAAIYRLASVYVCTSRHEGYCLPLVEAMYRQVPVISRRVGGTPEAMGAAGILYEDLSGRELAELIHRTVTDAGLRQRVLASQAKRLAQLAQRQVDAELRELLNALGPSRLTL